MSNPRDFSESGDSHSSSSTSNPSASSYYTPLQLYYCIIPFVLQWPLDNPHPLLQVLAFLIIITARIPTTLHVLQYHQAVLEGRTPETGPVHEFIQIANEGLFISFAHGGLEVYIVLELLNQGEPGFRPRSMFCVWYHIYAPPKHRGTLQEVFSYASIITRFTDYADSGPLGEEPRSENTPPTDTTKEFDDFINFIDNMEGGGLEGRMMLRFPFLSSDSQLR